MLILHILLFVIHLIPLNEANTSLRTVSLDVALPYEFSDLPPYFNLSIPFNSGGVGKQISFTLYQAKTSSSSALVYSSDEVNYTHRLPQCFYHALPQSLDLPNLSRINLQELPYGTLSLCEGGLKGYLRIPPSAHDPDVVYWIEPVQPTRNSSTARPSSLREQVQAPHRLTIIPSFDTQALGQDWPNLAIFRSEILFNTTQSKINHSIFGPDDQRFESHLSSLRDTVEAILRRQRRGASDKTAPSQDARFSATDPEPVRVVNLPNQPQPHILELYMIVDEVLAGAFRGNYDRLIYRVNMLITLVNAVYSRFNINIVIVRLEIWEQDRRPLNIEEHHLLHTLAQFKRMHTVVRHDCLHALLGIRDEGSRTRGKANPRTMCVFSRCVGYSRDSPSIDIAETARTMAHELGHNFGLRHDTEECKCQGCIMATGVEFGNNLMEWSPCSVRDLAALLKYGMGACLHDTPSRSVVAVTPTPVSKPTRLSTRTGLVPSVVQVYDWMKQSSPLSAYRAFSSPRRNGGVGSSTRSSSHYAEKVSHLCGNGQIDPGEECDCGTRDSCPQELRDCCDVERCRLKPGSECAGGPCCVVEPVHSPKSKSKFQCRLATSGTVCRNESGSCDLPEYCDGRSQWCPVDVYKVDGTVCSTDEGKKAYCIRGGCREAEGWCRVLWGKTSRRGNPNCFYENEVYQGGKADPIANCGKNRPTANERWEDAKSWPGIRCASWRDAECGRLWCHHQNEKAMLLGWVESQTKILRSTGEVCSALIYDPVWPASDPSTWDTNRTRQLSLSAAGVGIFASTTQDAGMVPDGTPCSRGFCYNGSCITESELPSRLACHCRGPSICNNLGHCHCYPGFHPPDCEYGGDGGSIDSGPPPPDTSPDPYLVVAMCITFFVVLPLIGFGLYCYMVHRCQCFPITTDPIIPTKSGLRRPFDHGLVDYLCRCCRPSLPASFTEFVTRPGRFKRGWPSSSSGSSERSSQLLRVVGHRKHFMRNLLENLGEGSDGKMALMGPDRNPSPSPNGSSYLSEASKTPYPILAYQDSTSELLLKENEIGWTNGYADHLRKTQYDVEVKVANGLPKSNLTNGSVLYSQTRLKPLKQNGNESSQYPEKWKRPNGKVHSIVSRPSLIEEIVDRDADETAGTGKGNRHANMGDKRFGYTVERHKSSVWQERRGRQEDSSPTKACVPTNTTENPETRIRSNDLISPPRLETMTYQGDMCSLNEAAVMSTLRRTTKPKNSNETNSKTNGMQTVLLRKVSQMRHLDYSPLSPSPSVSRSQSQRVGGLSPHDISQPRLENTTYKESLADLETARLQIRGATSSCAPGRVKSSKS
ncbi:unnamed protein product [Calicophoron daubneyi]|uniref:Uncharacterized protein n=1 Tax=Calicophoron daubneyi TaxID=300641 RepID=A0AAV2TPP4_CALDB